jgi:hypothetical protein
MHPALSEERPPTLALPLEEMLPELRAVAVLHAPCLVAPPLEEGPPVPRRLHPSLLLVAESAHLATQASSCPPGDMASGAQLTLAPRCSGAEDLLPAAGMPPALGPEACRLQRLGHGPSS